MSQTSWGSHIRVPAWIARLLPAALAVVGVIATVLITYGVFAGDRVLVADLSTYLLPGKGLLEGRGDLYVDYFDIKAPLTYAMLVPGLLLFGGSLSTWWVIYSLLLAVLFTFFWLCLRAVLSSWPALLALASCCLVLIKFRMLEELFFTTEILALTLVLGGVLLARRSQSTLALLVAGVLVGGAGNVKEVFLLAWLALIPFALEHPRGRWRGLVWAAAGVIGSYVLTVAVLVAWGPSVLTSYLEVLSFKRERFPAPTAAELLGDLGHYGVSIGAWLPLIASMVLGLVIAGALTRSPRVEDEKKSAVAWTPVNTAFVILLGAVLLGFIWQGGPMEVHYALAVVFPLYLAMGALIGWGLTRSRHLGTSARFAVAALLLASLIPAPSTIFWGVGSVRSIHAGALLDSALGLESVEDLAPFTAVSTLSGLNECIQVAYGWSASTYYWYSERDPCARFIVPPLALSPELSAEYRRALVEAPPSVLVLDPGLSSETTVPPDEGTADTTIVPFQAIAAACYQQVPDHPTLYIPTGDRAAVSACIAREVAQMPFEGGST